jgi:Stress responsive A/B Barrel Domain
MKKTSRRKFLLTASALGAVSAASSMPMGFRAQNKVLVHHAIFWLKNPGSTEDRDKLVEGVKTLGKIETIRDIHVGILASTEKRPVVDTSWSVSEVMIFSDLAAQATYQTHPIHLAFIKDYGHLWEKVTVYDAIDV